MNITTPPPSPLKRLSAALLTTTLATTLSMSALMSQAQADIFSVWVKPKFSYVEGTGDIFKRFEGSTAPGVELGVELLGLSLWGDFASMGQEQYWASGNLGIDLDFELVDSLILTAGAYGGVLAFNFPASGSQGSALEANKPQLERLLGPQYEDFESEYNNFTAAEESASNMAFGLNVRARASLEYEVMPFVRLGVEGLMGWHMITSGEEAAADLKARAVESFVEKQTKDLPPEQAELIKGQEGELKDALGAEKINVDDLKGTHFTVGAFLNIKF